MTVSGLPSLIVAKVPDIGNVEVPGTTWSELVEMSVPRNSG
jgi:hypothetical protein